MRRSRVGHRLSNFAQPLSPRAASYAAANSAIEVSPKRYRYTGKERDEETGLAYHGARYYAAWLARWAAADPVGLADGPNRYAYVNNNPLLYEDPTGMGGVLASEEPKASMPDEIGSQELSATERENFDAYVETLRQPSPQDVENMYEAGQDGGRSHPSEQVVGAYVNLVRSGQIRPKALPEGAQPIRGHSGIRGFASTTAVGKNAQGTTTEGLQFYNLEGRAMSPVIHDTHSAPGEFVIGVAAGGITGSVYGATAGGARGALSGGARGMIGMHPRGGLGGGSREQGGSSWLRNNSLSGYSQSEYKASGVVHGQAKDYSCTAAACRNILADNGIAASEVDVANAIGTTTSGTLLKDAEAGLRSLGLAEAKYHSELSLDGLQSLVSTRGPSLVGAQNIPGVGKHTLTVDSIVDGMVNIRDSLPGGIGSSYALKVADFLKHWRQTAVTP